MGFNLIGWLKMQVQVDKAETDLIVNLSPPTYVKKVTFFLGHAGFYRPFIKDFSRIVKPLTNLLAKNAPFHFSKECLVAFTKFNKALTSASILHPPIWGVPFELIYDTSDYAVEVVLG